MEKKIIEVISKVLNVEKNLLDKNTSIGDLVEWDSLGHLNIYFELEKQFNTKIDLELAATVRSINDWIDVIKKTYGNN